MIIFVILCAFVWTLNIIPLGHMSNRRIVIYCHEIERFNCEMFTALAQMLD